MPLPSVNLSRMAQTQTMRNPYTKNIYIYTHVNTRSDEFPGRVALMIRSVRRACATRIELAIDPGETWRQLSAGKRNKKKTDRVTDEIFIRWRDRYGGSKR